MRLRKGKGRIDLLIANAGMGISGPVELTAEETARRIMDVIFFGQIYIAQAVLPYMRTQRSGTIVFVSETMGTMKRWGRFFRSRIGTSRTVPDVS